MKLSRKTRSTLISALLIIIAALITWLSMGKEQANPPSQTPDQPANGTVQVQYLDVGQADSELIRLPNGKTVLIDAGGNATAKNLVSYLKSLGIQKIDYLVGTHPHEDHIGGLDAVINAFEIGRIDMPRVADNQTPTTKTYEDVLTAIDKKGLTINAGKGGDVIFNEEGCRADVLAPNSDAYGEMNNYSIVVMLTYGEKKFLFMGDAQTDSEKEILERFSVKADVLKCGHHGSSTSTGSDFLKKVAPNTAVISCGKDNSYGHPHKETLSLLQKNNVAIYRTDEDHTILASCDGKTITFSTTDVSLV